MKDFKKKSKRLIFGAVALGSTAMLSSSSYMPEPFVQDDVVAEDKGAGLDVIDWINSDSFRQYLPVHDRALTRAEREMAHGILGTQVNVNGVRIVAFANDIHDYNSAEFWANNTNYIYLDERDYSEDYAREDEVDQLGVFIERLVLLRQNREGMQWPGNARIDQRSRYFYTLDYDKSFSGYDRFQQAAIMGDYAQRFVHPSHNGIANCEDDNILMRTIEREFFNAVHYRLALPTPKSMQLFTRDETNLAHAIFGDEIDVSQTRKYFSNRKCEGADIFTNINNSLHFHGAEYFRDNYATVEDDDLWGAFVHELTHIWQLQQEGGMSQNPLGSDHQRYHYDLTADKTFEDYTVEQQAEIIRHYAVIYLRENGMDKPYSQNRDLLRRTVEDRFPVAAQSRINYAETGRYTIARPVQINTPLNL